MRTVFLLVLAIGYPLVAGWQLHRRKLRDRLDAVLILLAGVLFLLFARATIDWQAVPPWLWLIGLALLAVDVMLTGWAWADLPWISSRRARRLSSATIQLAIAAALVVVLL